jgi:hypothetical protein
MTNHPRRADDEQAAEIPAADAASETDEAAPPGHTPNGHRVPPGLQPNASKLIGEAVAGALKETLPGMLFQAMTQALSQVPVRTIGSPFQCATCVIARISWVGQHGDDLKAAEAEMIAATYHWPPDDPRRQQVNVLMFLPQHLQPSADPAAPNPQACPNVQAGIVMTGGQVLCPDHIPGVTTQPGRKEFLIAHQPLTQGLIAEVMGQPRAT